MTINNTTDLDGTYAFSTSRLNTLILFFKYFFLSLTSTEFYRNILSRNKESGKKHLLFCSILAGILFVCVIPIKLYEYLLLLFATASPGIVLGGLFIIFLVVTMSEYVFINLTLKLFSSTQSKDNDVYISKESLFRLQAFSISPCFVFIPSIMLLLGSLGLIVLVIIYFISTLIAGPIYMEHRK